MQHTLAVIVENKPGVLARVSAMFSNRGFNIHSLAVGPTHVDGRSRITLVVDAPELEQLKKQLHKLVNVIKVHELVEGEGIEREVMLVRVSSTPSTLGELRERAGLFDARVVDVAENSLTFEVSGSPENLSAFLDQVKPYGVMDLVKSGRIAIRRTSAFSPHIPAGAGTSS